MSASVPFLSPGLVSRIQGLARQGFATQLALADPPVMVQAYRSGGRVGAPVHVLVVPANRQSRDGGGPGALEVSLSGGVLRAWAPWDIETADLVRIGHGTAVIRSVPPVRNGIQDAVYEMGNGGGT